MTEGLCDLVERKWFFRAFRHLRLFRVGVFALAPETLGAPQPRFSEARREGLRAQLVSLRNAVDQEGSQLVLISLADPLADAEEVRALGAQLGVPTFAFDRAEFEAFENIPNETHWTAGSTRTAAEIVARWLQAELEREGR